MELSSLTYLVFLGCAASAHALLPERFRNAFLLAVSAVFYAWGGPVMLLVPAVVTAVSYGAALCMERQENEKKKKAVLIAAVALQLAALCFFKYADLWGRLLREPVALALPLGISFFTFEAVGYCIDVYHGRVAAERDLCRYALAVFFFPQIVSGPIGRARDLLPQLMHRQPTPALAGEGLRRLLMGALAKLAVADGLGILIDAAYGDPEGAGGLAVLAAMALYPLQLYFDFAGYSSMAIGSALLFGIRLGENFLAPYFAPSLSVFWKRWHISLTAWLQDYVFTPLVWSRWWNRLLHPRDWQQRAPQLLANLMIVFLLSGVWHGAASGYLIWGALMGLGRVAEELLRRGKKKKETGFRLLAGRAAVYLYWGFSLLFFRLGSAGAVLQAFRAVLPLRAAQSAAFLLNAAANGISAAGTHRLIFFGCIAVGLGVQLWCDSRTDRSLRQKGAQPLTDPLAALPPAPRWALYWLMGFAAAAMYLITRAGGAPSFIYGGY